VTISRPTPGPSPESLKALRADLRWFLRQNPGASLLQATRALQLRTATAWSVLAPLLESGEVVVRQGGLVVSDRVSPR
jgi:hypothetical protein